MPGLLAPLPKPRITKLVCVEVCSVVTRSEGAGAARDEMEVQIEVRQDAASRDGLKDKLEKRLREDLGVSVGVTLVAQGALAEIANTGGREGKARRLVDRRPGYQSK